MTDIYESINIIARCREEGENWFDIIAELISKDCNGGGGECIVEDGDESDCDDHEHTDLFPCTCGLVTMGGTRGTLEQCYTDQEHVGNGLKLIDLARTIMFLSSASDAPFVPPAERSKVIAWAQGEVQFEDDYGNL